MAIELTSIKGLERIDSGAIGTVYRVPAGGVAASIQKPLALKKYKKSVLNGQETAMSAYLEVLIRRRTEASGETRAILDYHTTWPLVLVTNQGRPCGFLMNLIPDQYFITIDDDLGKYVMTARLDSILDTDEHRRKMGLPLLNGTGRAKITLDLLGIVSTLHESRTVIGDISPTNILVHVDATDQGHNRVLVIDTDSFRVMTEINPFRQQHTGGWQPPESLAAEATQHDLIRNGGNKYEISRLNAQIATQNTQTDVYKIALAITRLYHTGERRTVIRTSDSARQRLEQSYGKPFADLIDRGLSTTPSHRPTATELYNGLKTALRRYA